MTKAKKVGRFKVTDNDRRLRRRDDGEDTFISDLHDEGEEPKETELNEPGGFVGAPATVDQDLSPMQEAMQRFKTASDRRNFVGRGADEGQFLAQLEGTNEEERERFNRGAEIGAPRAQEPLTPIQQFKRASDRMHNIGGAADRKSAADAKTPIQKFVQATNARYRYRS